MTERMKPHEFFKAMGYNTVKKLVQHDNIRRLKDKLELQRLIASWELVESLGGLCKVQAKLDNVGLGYTNEQILNMRVAVQDYVNCYSLAHVTTNPYNAPLSIGNNND